MPSRSLNRITVRLVLITIAIGTGITCGGGSPTSASGSNSSSTGPASACRTFSTADSAVLTSTAGVSGTIANTCQPYNRSTNELSCAQQYSDSRGVSFSTATVTTFAAVDDYVGDAPRVFIVSTATVHPTRITTTQSTGINSTTTLSYDSQGRVTRRTIQSNAGSDVQNFSGWDSFGRPTTSTLSTASLAYAYDDTARTATITNNQGGTITQSFDADGILIRQVSVTGGGTETQTYTIQSRATVCRIGNP